jgi:hypothetical protein
MFDIEISLLTANLLLTYYLLIRLKEVGEDVDCLHSEAHRVIDSIVTSMEEEADTPQPRSYIKNPFREWDEG